MHGRLGSERLKHAESPAVTFEMVHLTKRR